MKDKKHTEETKKKISESRKGKVVGEDNHRFNNYSTITRYGYKKIKAENHPYADILGYVFEHRLVMEKKIGRFLKPKERVHHLDGNKLNNNPKNLQLFSTNGEHTRHHLKERWKNHNPRCKVCGERAVSNFLCNKHYLRQWRGNYFYG